MNSHPQPDEHSVIPMKESIIIPSKTPEPETDLPTPIPNEQKYRMLIIVFFSSLIIHSSIYFSMVLNETTHFKDFLKEDFSAFLCVIIPSSLIIVACLLGLVGTKAFSRKRLPDKFLAAILTLSLTGTIICLLFAQGSLIKCALFGNGQCATDSDSNSSSDKDSSLYILGALGGLLYYYSPLIPIAVFIYLLRDYIHEDIHRQRYVVYFVSGLYTNMAFAILVILYLNC